MALQFLLSGLPVIIKLTPVLTLGFKFSTQTRTSMVSIENTKTCLSAAALAQLQDAIQNLTLSINQAFGMSPSIEIDDGPVFLMSLSTAIGSLGHRMYSTLVCSSYILILIFPTL